MYIFFSAIDSYFSSRKTIFVPLLIIALCLTAMPSVAQKKLIAEAEESIKKGKDLDKAEKKMDDLLGDSANQRNHKIWLTKIAAQRAQYDEGNEKLYLKQKYDTASFFHLTRKLFKSIEQFDSIETLPDKKGRVRVRYRERHGDFLHTIRPNLYHGGAFFLKKKNYGDAFRFFQEYIDCDTLPLFEGRHYTTSDPQIPRAAYWTMFCGYQLKDSAMTMRYDSLARRDTARLASICQYEAEIFQLHEDTVRFVAALQEGFSHSPQSPYFFPRLLEYFTRTDQLDSALVISDRALAADSTNQLYRFAKSSVLLNLGRYDETINLCRQLIESNDTFADAYYNMGLAYFNQAIEMENERMAPRKKRQCMRKLYQECRPYMERYRQLAPDERQRWMPILYTIYLNLNMGKEFEEIDAMMRHS